jgi:hypothetical protein
MEAVLQWGGVFSAVTRNASLFAKVARSLLLQPGRPDRDDLADLVDWNALSGLERLELAMRLNPGAIRTQDFAAAVNELDEATARKDEGDRDTPRPSGDPPRRLPMVGASYAAGVIAEAAWISDTACTGTLADFLAKRLSEIVGSQAQIASASPVLLVGAASLARYAAGCPALRQRAFEVLEAMKARGSVALAEGLRSAAANSIGPTLLRSSVELACMTGAPLDDSARATLLGFAVAHMQGAPGITETETAPTSAVSVDATIAVLEMERIGRSGCQL